MQLTHRCAFHEAAASMLSVTLAGRGTPPVPRAGQSVMERTLPWDCPQSSAERQVSEHHATRRAGFQTMSCPEATFQPRVLRECMAWTLLSSGEARSHRSSCWLKRYVPAVENLDSRLRVVVVCRCRQRLRSRVAPMLWPANAVPRPVPAPSKAGLAGGRWSVSAGAPPQMQEPKFGSKPTNQD